AQHRAYDGLEVVEYRRFPAERRAQGDVQRRGVITRLTPLFEFANASGCGQTTDRRLDGHRLYLRSLGDLVDAEWAFSIHERQVQLVFTLVATFALQGAQLFRSRRAIRRARPFTQRKHQLTLAQVAQDRSNLGLVIIG